MYKFATYCLTLILCYPLHVSERVRVYWNLHKNIWSIMKKGKVIGHRDTILLKDVRFIVSQAGRNRVLKEKKKNVHAFAEGIVIDNYEYNRLDQITYNPYKFPYFYYKRDESIALIADRVVLENKKIFTTD